MVSYGPTLVLPHSPCNLRKAVHSMREWDGGWCMSLPPSLPLFVTSSLHAPTLHACASLFVSAPGCLCVHVCSCLCCPGACMYHYLFVCTSSFVVVLGMCACVTNCSHLSPLVPATWSPQALICVCIICIGSKYIIIWHSLIINIST